ncbi:hypothetical protein, partial [Pseudomonas amygdali]|uniref:hypothetical protein n=1 Tax=Pseudomonas amygdali TaxID=47877 RepID=UPI001C815234
MNDQSIKNNRQVFAGKRQAEKRLNAGVLEDASRRRFVMRSVTHGIPTLEREERSPQLSCDA